MTYDLVIIGGGPAGAAAAVYAARKQMRAVIITETFGGQSVVSNDIQNWIGEVKVTGVELAKKLENHVRAHKNLEVVTGDRAERIERRSGGEGFLVTTKKGGKYETKTVILAQGASRRKLQVPGEEEFNGKGVAYCATCDAPLFGGREVAVVGGGNSGLESVLDLVPYASKIYLLERGTTLKGDKVTQDQVKASKKVEIIFQAEVKEIKGEQLVTGLVYKDLAGGEEKELPLGGVFVEIGSVPNSEMVKGLAKLNERGEVVVDHKTQRSSLVGIWAAGDVADCLYKQNNTSAGDAIKAVLNIQEYLNKEIGKDS